MSQATRATCVKLVMDLPPTTLRWKQTNWWLHANLVNCFYPHYGLLDLKQSINQSIIPAEGPVGCYPACRKRRLPMGLFLFFCPISRLLVRSSDIYYFQNPPLNSSVLLAWMEAGLFWCLLPDPCWNRRAVMWFHLSICSLVILPSLVAYSIFSLFLLLAQSPAYFPEISVFFFSSSDRLFCIAFVFF